MANLVAYNGFSFKAGPLFEDINWECRVLSLDVCDGYFRVILDTYDETITFLCGNIGYHWIFFPESGLGTVLSNYNDMEYNYRKLYEINDDHTAISIVYALIEIEKYISFQMKKEEFA